MNKFVVANPARSPSDAHAIALQRQGLLQRYFVGRRNLPAQIDPALGCRWKSYFLPEYAAAMLTRSAYWTEWVRFGCSPFFDRWVLPQLPEGCHILAGFGYINRCLKRVRQRGGKVFLDARNSHPANFWELVGEEYKRWGCPLPPIPPFHNRRQRESAELADYVFVPSTFVRDSFLARGFTPEQLLLVPYPVDVTRFTPPERDEMPRDRFVIACTGQVSLRKGTPYLLDAFIAFRKEVPHAELKLVSSVADNMEPLLKSRYAHLEGVSWHEGMNHTALAQFLRESSVFVLPSIEEGMVRTALEAMATGLPAIVTPNTGVNDYILEGQNGSVVPICDSQAIVEKLHYWHDQWRCERENYKKTVVLHTPELGEEHFDKKLMTALAKAAI